MPVRTTLTLDDDVAAGLRRTARVTGRPFRAVVNDALRVGLDSRGARAVVRFQVAPSDLGLRAGIDLDSISELIEALEGPEHR